MHRRINGVDAGTIQRHVVALESGARFTLTEWIDDVDALVARLRRETAARLLPKLRARLAAPGGRVDFGEVALLGEGVEAAKRVVPFAQIERADVAQGTLVLARRGEGGTPWARVPVSRVTNAHLLLALLAERTRRS
jgi:hypothetical protein